MLIAWANKAGLEFTRAALAVCAALGWPADFCSWLMACIAFESGGTFSPSVRNAAGSGAVGLIQFMASTAVGLGTTTEALAAMTAVEQLAYVEKYFRPYASRIRSLPDMYMAILMPHYVGAPGDTAVFSYGVAYRENSGLDSNHDGRVTKDEAAAHVQAQFDRGMQPGNVGTA